MFDEIAMNHLNSKAIYLTLLGRFKVLEDLKPSTVKIGKADMQRVLTAKSRQISIGIIGAGFSGLRCADVLLQHGFKVTVIEARDRLGGRVAQSTHLGHPVDLGPNWIHGTDNNPIADVAKQTGTQLQAWDEESLTYDSNGEVLDEAEDQQYSELFWDDGVIAQAFRHSNRNNESIDPHTSLYDFIADKAKNFWIDESPAEAKRKRETYLKLAYTWSCYIGSPVTRQSLKFFWLEECISGENPFVAETYEKILDAIAAPARAQADIRLNTEVVSICNSENGTPSFRTAHGTELSFDEVVVTTPLGWLKNNKAAFSPPLPARLSSAIDNISYGTLDKVYVTFPTAFWNTTAAVRSSSSTNGIDARGTTPNVTATTAPLHQPQSNSKPKTYLGFVHWLEPHYAPDTNPEKWMQEGMNLAALQDNCAHPTLLFYISGPQSKHIGDLVSSSSAPEERDAKLTNFFQPYYSRLPNYDPANPDCVPTACLATAWVNDKFAGYGSYANFQIGLEKGDEDIETMRHGLPERHVWLAGEHTAPFIACGTTTGAYWSGEAVAERIVKEYGVAQIGGMRESDA